MENLDKEFISKSLLDWDEKHTGILKQLYEAHIEEDDFIPFVIELFLNQKEYQHSTSWLIKHHFDTKKTLSKWEIEMILTHFKTLTFWGAQLHILQIIPKVDLSKQVVVQIEEEIWSLLHAENIFLRAAAFEAYFEVLKQVPQKEEAFILKCLSALTNEKASVKVKIKRILKKLSYSTST